MTDWEKFFADLGQDPTASLRRVWNEGETVFYEWSDGLGGGFVCGHESAASHVVAMASKAAKNGGPKDDELDKKLLAYLSESKRLASAIGERLGVGGMVGGEPLPQKLEEILRCLHECPT